jgi:hypothetical protein
MGCPITFVWPTLAQIAHVKTMNVFLREESRRESPDPKKGGEPCQRYDWRNYPSGKYRPPEGKPATCCVRHIVVIGGSRAD